MQSYIGSMTSLGVTMNRVLAFPPKPYAALGQIKNRIERQKEIDAAHDREWQRQIEVENNSTKEKTNVY